MDAQVSLAYDPISQALAEDHFEGIVSTRGPVALNSVVQAANSLSTSNTIFNVQIP